MRKLSKIPSTISIINILIICALLITVFTYDYNPSISTSPITIRDDFPDVITTYVSAGETLYIEIIELSTPVKIEIEQALDVASAPIFQKMISAPEKITITFNTSQQVFIYLRANSSTTINAQIYIKGMSWGIILAVIIIIILVVSTLKFEQLLTKPTFSYQILDEIKSINIPTILLLLPLFLLYIGSGVSENSLLDSGNSNKYSQSIHIFSIYDGIMVKMGIPLVIVLIALSIRQINQNKIMMYKATPIEGLKQYRSRIAVHSIVILQISLFMVIESYASRMTTFSGIEYIMSVHIPAIIIIILSALVFIFIQILILDIIPQPKLKVFTLPLVLLIYIAIQTLYFPILKFVLPVDRSAEQDFSIEPDILFWISEAIIIISVTIILNILYRKSKYFRPN